MESFFFYFFLFIYFFLFFQFYFIFKLYIIVLVEALNTLLIFPSSKKKPHTT